ncbi:MAG: hypothetical protein J7K82_01075 [Thermoproteales archaeon]|nr:hypothetical protein [Thermoproteales archaeon]
MKKEKEAAIKALRKDGRVRKLLTEIPKELSEKFTFSLRDLAKRHNISYGKTSKLIERLYRNKVLVIKAIPNYHVLGLKPIFLIVKPEIENWLDKAFKMTYFKFGSWIYGNGKYALITLIPPLDKIKNHLSYVEANIGKIKEYHILNRLLPAAPNLDYLFEAKTPWNKLPMREAREVLYRIVFDKIDIESLSRLEQDGLTKITDLARDLKINRKTLEYRLRTRVRNIIEGFSMHLNVFQYEEAPKYMFVVSGDHIFKLSSLVASPYPTELYMGDKIAIALINLPSKERLDFLEYLSTIGEWFEYQVAPGGKCLPLRVKALVGKNKWADSITV